MPHSLKARLEEFSKAKAKKVPTFPKTYSIGVSKNIKEKFNMISSGSNILPRPTSPHACSPEPGP